MGAISFLCCFFAIIISQGSAQTCDNEKGNYTSDSAYHDNLKVLHTLLSTFTFLRDINYGFYNFSYGEHTDKVYVIGLCRADINPDTCLSCLSNSSVSLTQNCPNQKEAIMWTGECMLRYSHRSIFGVLENDPKTILYFTKKVTGSVDAFNEALAQLMRNLTKEAASGDSRRKFALGTSPAGFQTIYGNVQCTPDLSSEECSNCLSDAISEIPGCCSGYAGVNVLKPSCRIRFDPYSYFGPLPKLDPDVPPSPQPQLSTRNPSTQGKSNSPLTAIAIAVAVVVVVLVLCFIFIYLKVRRPRDIFETEDDDDEIKTHESLQLQFYTIRIATNDFSDSNKLGQGGFGAVYRGRFSNGREIAVKRLSRDSRQGDIEFKNEVLLVAKLQHRNLVRLLGFCLEGREKLLVYEFVPNKSLDYFIFDETMKTELAWQNRYKIIGGIARGILYLHEDSRLRVIHRDIKASNILLDQEMNPKIADFGMARLFGLNQIHGDTNRIVGTYGYMAPEYAMHGQFSVKSDVFSFGVLVLEILSGLKNHGIRHGENAEDLLSFN
ncbi:cysteine-rich receptor-like protein kinase 26 isoform X5 [Abrus precatorius]|uniref:Cysteine-rich receptor-like protein kinase 26 isoform X5 n=1 Tax=Abrus precatorius TaxID=3816 RepID=A0A8B8M8S3_ABRPR|nr:cysteine-rich receptor-like protein kinase 26 isoform X5 [Abrus precatorius]